MEEAGEKKARNGKARPPKFGCALRPNAVVDAEDTRMKGEKKKERIGVEVGNKRKRGEDNRGREG